MSSHLIVFLSSIDVHIFPLMFFVEYILLILFGRSFTPWRHFLSKRCNFLFERRNFIFRSGYPSRESFYSYLPKQV